MENPYDPKRDKGIDPSLSSCSTTSETGEELPDINYDSSSPQTSKTEPKLCRVCGRAPGIPIYRSIACGSCRIFFLRHSVPQKKMQCKFGNNCCYNSTRAQVKCVACRYQKCLDAGLQPLLAGRRTHCRRGTNESPKDLSDKESPNEEGGGTVGKLTQDIVRIQDYEMSAEIYPSAFRLETNKDDALLLESLLELEKFCLQDDVEAPLDISFKLDLNIPFAELWTNPTIVCPRVPAGFDRFPPVTKEIPKDFLARCFVRGMLQLADWLRATPELWLLEEKDRITFGTSLYPVVSLLQALYYSYKNKLNGVAAGFNTDFQVDGMTSFPEDGDYFKNVATYAHKMILPIFETIDLKIEEYLLFKNVLIFTSAVGVSDQGAEVIRSARKKYELKLLDQLKARSVEDSDVLRNVSLLMNVRKILISIAHRGDPLISRCCVFNTGGLGGRLAADVFFQ